MSDYTNPPDAGTSTAAEERVHDITKERHALELRAEVINLVAGRKAERKGLSDRLEIGIESATDTAYGKEELHVGGGLTEEANIAETTGLMLSMTVYGKLNLNYYSDTLITAGGMLEQYTGGEVIAAGMSDNLLGGGGIRIRGADLRMNAASVMEEKVSTLAIDGLVAECCSTACEREEGNAIYSVGFASYKGTMEVLTGTTIRPMCRALFGVRTKNRGGGGSGGDSNEPSSDQPPTPAEETPPKPPPKPTKTLLPAGGSSGNSVGDLSNTLRTATNASQLEETASNADVAIQAGRSTEGANILNGLADSTLVGELNSPFKNHKLLPDNTDKNELLGLLYKDMPGIDNELAGINKKLYNLEKGKFKKYSKIKKIDAQKKIDAHVTTVIILTERKKITHLSIDSIQNGYNPIQRLESYKKSRITDSRNPDIFSTFGADYHILLDIENKIDFLDSHLKPYTVEPLEDVNARIIKSDSQEHALNMMNHIIHNKQSEINKLAGEGLNNITTYNDLGIENIPVDQRTLDNYRELRANPGWGEHIGKDETIIQAKICSQFDNINEIERLSSEKSILRDLRAIVEKGQDPTSFLNESLNKSRGIEKNPDREVFLSNLIVFMNNFIPADDLKRPTSASPDLVIENGQTSPAGSYLHQSSSINADEHPTNIFNSHYNDTDPPVSIAKTEPETPPETLLHNTYQNLEEAAPKKGLGYTDNPITRRSSLPMESSKFNIPKVQRSSSVENLKITDSLSQPSPAGATPTLTGHTTPDPQIRSQLELTTEQIHIDETKNIEPSQQKNIPTNEANPSAISTKLEGESAQWVTAIDNYNNNLNIYRPRSDGLKLEHPYTTIRRDALKLIDANSPKPFAALEESIKNMDYDQLYTKNIYQEVLDTIKKDALRVGSDTNIEPQWLNDLNDTYFIKNADSLIEDNEHILAATHHRAYAIDQTIDDINYLFKNNFEETKKLYPEGTTQYEEEIAKMRKMKFLMRKADPYAWLPYKKVQRNLVLDPEFMDKIKEIDIEKYNYIEKDLKIGSDVFDLLSNGSVSAGRSLPQDPTLTQLLPQQIQALTDNLRQQFNNELLQVKNTDPNYDAIKANVLEKNKGLAIVDANNAEPFGLIQRLIDNKSTDPNTRNTYKYILDKIKENALPPEIIAPQQLSDVNNESGYLHSISPLPEDTSHIPSSSPSPRTGLEVPDPIQEASRHAAISNMSLDELQSQWIKTSISDLRSQIDENITQLKKFYSRGALGGIAESDKPLKIKILNAIDPDALFPFEEANRIIQSLPDEIEDTGKLTLQSVQDGAKSYGHLLKVNPDPIMVNLSPQQFEKLTIELTQRNVDQLQEILSTHGRYSAEYKSARSTALDTGQALAMIDPGAPYPLARLDRAINNIDTVSVSSSILSTYKEVLDSIKKHALTLPLETNLAPQRIDDFNNQYRPLQNTSALPSHSPGSATPATNEGSFTRYVGTVINPGTTNTDTRRLPQINFGKGYYAPPTDEINKNLKAFESTANNKLHTIDANNVNTTLHGILKKQSTPKPQNKSFLGRPPKPKKRTPGKRIKWSGDIKYYEGDSLYNNTTNLGIDPIQPQVQQLIPNSSSSETRQLSNSAPLNANNPTYKNNKSSTPVSEVI